MLRPANFALHSASCDVLSSFVFAFSAISAHSSKSLGALRHHAVLHELANWDGLLYRQLANNGYPNFVPHARSTLGFFPLYPLMMWPLGHVMSWITGKAFINGLTLAGLTISGIGGMIMAVLVQRLAALWWGEQTARRAVVAFCLFPGAVVFSMASSEGLTLPLVVLGPRLR